MRANEQEICLECFAALPPANLPPQCLGLQIVTSPHNISIRGTSCHKRTKARKATSSRKPIKTLDRTFERARKPAVHLPQPAATCRNLPQLAATCRRNVRRQAATRRPPAVHLPQPAVHLPQPAATCRNLPQLAAATCRRNLPPQRAAATAATCRRNLPPQRAAATCRRNLPPQLAAPRPKGNPPTQTIVTR